MAGGSIYRLVRFSALPDDPRDVVYTKARCWAIRRNVSTSAPFVLAPEFFLQTKTLPLGCQEMLKSKKFWLEVAKVVTAVAFVILWVIYLIFTLHSCEVASRSFFATTGHLIAPWVFLSFAVRMCVDRVHKFSNVLLSFFVDFGQEPQQATGIAFRVKLVETANAAISQLQNEK